MRILDLCEYFKNDTHNFRFFKEQLKMFTVTLKFELQRSFKVLLCLDFKPYYDFCHKKYWNIFFSSNLARNINWHLPGIGQKTTKRKKKTQRTEFSQTFLSFKKIVLTLDCLKPPKKILTGALIFLFWFYISYLLTIFPMEKCNNIYFLAIMIFFCLL